MKAIPESSSSSFAAFLGVTPFLTAFVAFAGVAFFPTFAGGVLRNKKH